MAYHATPVTEAVGTITGRCGMQASASITISDPVIKGNPQPARLRTLVTQVLDRGDVLLSNSGSRQLDADRHLGLNKLAESLLLGDQLG